MLSTVFNVDKRVPSTYLVGFDETAFATIIFDNSVNTHICNDRKVLDPFKWLVHQRLLSLLVDRIMFLRGSEQWFGVGKTMQASSIPIKFLGCIIFRHCL